MSTATASATTTMTEARVRAVMQKVGANFWALVVSGHLDRHEAQRWVDDLIYLQVEEALDFFEVQVTSPQGERFGLRYTVRADGSVQQDSKSGGIDLYGFSSGTRVNLYAHLRYGIPQSVREELQRRRWGFNGTRLQAEISERRAFSKDGYGLIREKLGQWP